MNTITRVFNETFEERNLHYVQSSQPVAAQHKTSNIGFLLLENFSLPCFTQALDVLVIVVLEDPLDPAQLCHYVALSQRQMQRLFRDQLNTTPQKYYLQLRLTEARRLIQNSVLSIVDVSLACGFVSSSHFSKCYSAHFGHPPSRETRHEI